MFAFINKCNKDELCTIVTIQRPGVQRPGIDAARSNVMQSDALADTPPYRLNTSHLLKERASWLTTLFVCPALAVLLSDLKVLQQR